MNQVTNQLRVFSMEPLKPRKSKGSGPEAVIERAIADKLRKLGWIVIHTHGNEYQMGFPDLWCAHRRYGQRWIEVKNPSGYTFTPAQREVFPLMASADVGIWVLTSDDDYEINKLFGPANWWAYFK